METVLPPTETAITPQFFELPAEGRKDPLEKIYGHEKEIASDFNNAIQVLSQHHKNPGKALLVLSKWAMAKFDEGELPQALTPKEMNTYFSEEQYKRLHPFIKTYKHLMKDLIICLAAKEGGTPEQDFTRRLGWAKFNQQLSQEFYAAGCCKPSSPYRKRVDFFLATMEAMYDHRPSPLNNTLQSVCRGAVSQAWIMKLVTECLPGYSLYLPDPKNDEEMIKTDMRGIDGIVITPKNEAIIFDCKSSLTKTDLDEMDDGESTRVRALPYNAPTYNPICNEIQARLQNKGRNPHLHLSNRRKVKILPPPKLPLRVCDTIPSWQTEMYHHDLEQTVSHAPALTYRRQLAQYA